jgi:creatinine amidohydrolase
LRYKIQEMSWVEFDERRKGTRTVIVPTGAVEVYGPHLPMGADSIVAEALALRVAEMTGALVAPAIQMGESSMLLDFPGTLSLGKPAYEAAMDDLCRALIGYGFQNLMFMNGHSGNVDSINYLARRYQRERGVRCGQVDWWRFAAANGDGILELKGHMAHGHASECGTSVMLYLRPDLVDMSKATRIEPATDAYQVFTDVIRYLPFGSKTPNGTIGDATIASAAKGKALVERCVGRIAAYMVHEFGPQCAPRQISGEKEKQDT